MNDGSARCGARNVGHASARVAVLVQLRGCGRSLRRSRRARSPARRRCIAWRRQRLAAASRRCARPGARPRRPARRAAPPTAPGRAARPCAPSTRFGAEDQALGQTGPDQPREALRAARGRQQAEAGFGQAEPGLVRGDAQVAGQRQSRSRRPARRRRSRPASPAAPTPGAPPAAACRATRSSIRSRPCGVAMLCAHQRQVGAGAEDPAGAAQVQHRDRRRRRRPRRRPRRSRRPARRRAR